jgi:SPFH domain / Band 7 family
MFVGPIMGKFLDYSHHIYRCTYLASFGLTVPALLAGFLLHSKFMARGRPIGWPDCRHLHWRPHWRLADCSAVDVLLHGGSRIGGCGAAFREVFKTVEPGLHFKLPFGIDSVTVLPTQRQLKLEFGFSTSGYTTNPIQASQNPEEEKSMVTGDLNAALVEWVVQYRIEDPRQYLFDVRNPGKPSAICPKPQCVR